MSLRDFQRAFTAMTLDARFANAVHAQGARALVAYQLSTREARRLAHVVRQPGMALNCTLARANRFAGIHDAFAMSCVLLGKQLRGLLDELWDGHQPDNVQLQGEDQAFAALLQSRLADEPGATAFNEYLPAIAAYEMACLELAQLVRHAARPELAPRESRWVAFAHDPQLLMTALEQRQAPPPGLPRGDWRVRITLADAELEVTTFEMPPATAPMGPAK